MLKLKRYIINNKQLFIIVLGGISFLFFHNYAYCELSFFQKWYSSVENYFLNLTWEKAISDPIELSKSIGWVSIGAISSLYAFEGIWNGRLLVSKFLYNYTPFGHLDDGSGIIKSWFGFRNTAGPLKNIIDNVPYEEIWPLYWARNYVFPYIFIQTRPNGINSNEANTNLTPTTADNSLIIRPNIPEITSSNNVERIREVDHYFEVPVYINKYIPVVEYKSHENLTSLENEIVNLSRACNDLRFLQSQQKSREELITEITSLSEHESAVCLTKIELDKRYSSYYLPGVTEENSYVLTPMKLKQIYFPFQQGENIRILFDETRLNVTLPDEVFKQKYPTIYLTVNTLARSEQGTVKPIYIDLVYIDNRSLFGSTFKLDPLNCFLIEDSGIEWWQKGETYKLLTKMEEIQISTLQSANTELGNMVNALREKVEEEQRLISIETINQGTQTMNFSINDMFFDEINSYLEIQDQTSFITALQAGQNLPFNELNAINIQAGIEMMKKYKEAKKAKQDIKQASKEQEVSIQTEPVTHENVEILGINSNIFQNMGTLFSAALIWSIAHDFQTLDLVARSLLGFIHIPEYNQAFIAATQMSVIDLQMEYGFSLDDARRAYDSIEYANTMRTTGSLPDDLSSSLSNSNDYLDQAQNSMWSWKDYLLVTSGLVIACGTLYYMYQSIKVGAPADSIQSISPNVEAWKSALYDKINKL